MAVFKLFSARQQEEKELQDDVFVYDKIPDRLKNQFILILEEVFPNGYVRTAYNAASANVLNEIRTIIRKEHGYLQLPPYEKARYNVNADKEVQDYLLQLNDSEKILDIFELGLLFIGHFHEQNFENQVEEINYRFKENGVGYRFDGGRIIRVDSELLHVETVKPALKLLQSSEYEGAQEEFLGAYEHYRHGKHKEALADCLKSFESVMKSICEQNNWQYGKADNAKKLIAVCLKNELVPSFLQAKLSSLQALLENSIPTVRNKLGGHGQGSETLEVPEYIVSYVLHMTASTIVMLIRSQEDLLR
ncbi:hypothetical protein JX580_06545 [Thiomicrospira microaerophila]|uniref:STM4504/CBY_0614 family protein n=1 Tax=Thiomicrospira microaerophila TaxID=406020 RepID=UPI00200BA54F|nr:hypothetical protein [Thiomicrospira microaerophila]UQB41358.1 hypothetical protein JX580_06545 [Thiomicrospira microaerophila]